MSFKQPFPGLPARTSALLAAGLYAACAFSQQVPEVRAPAPDAYPAGILERVSANSLRGHVSFLASDVLEGRETPSKGLDIAAEYIAAQFRRAGLQPGGDDGYFQTASLFRTEPNTEGFSLRLEHDGRTVSISAGQVSISGAAAVKLDGAPLVKIDLNDPAALDGFDAKQLEGKVAAALAPDFDSLDQAGRERIGKALARFRREAQKWKPALTLIFGAGHPGRHRGSLSLTWIAQQKPAPVSIALRSAEAAALLASIPNGGKDATVHANVASPLQAAVRVRNVIGVLPGSDAVLKDTYLLVTAHYDHEGVDILGVGDTVYNGANDDASGVAGVLELAEAIASAKERPKRSIVFMAFFGEEKGLYGARYYVRHPVFPLAATIGNVNLEHLGRTDSTDGPQLESASLTGFDYSSIPGVFQRAGEMTSIRVFEHPSNGMFFTRSDNAALAAAGIPAHTLAVSYIFPDYHAVGDEWPKIDYENLAKVTRMIAAGVMMIAGDPEPPKWNRSNSSTGSYVKAQEKLMGR